ncbi:MAG: response regulator [Rhizobacter sp.]|nr:response regulator [Rhizobacter sp.]
MKVSLRTALVVMLLVATVPVAALMCYQLLDKMRGDQARMRVELQREASLLAQAVDSEMATSIEALRILALSESLRSGDVREFERAVAGRGPLRSGWQGSFLTDARGLVLFDTTGAARRGTPAPVPGFGRMLDVKAPLVSSLIDHKPSGRPSAVIAVPVVIDGELRYGLGVWVPWATWQLLLKRATPDDAMYSVLFDRGRRIVAGSVNPQAHVGRTLPDAWTDGEPVYEAADTVPSAGWGVRLGVAATPVAAAQLRSMAAAWATAAGCLLLGVSLALLVARRVTRPLGLLARDGGASVPQRSIHVREIALLYQALRSARERDLAARDGLRRKADEFETLFNSSPIGLSVAQDCECASVLHNAAMGHLFGLVDEPGAEGAGVFHHGEPLPPERMPLCVAARSGQAVAMMELEFRRPGQPVIHAIANAVPLRDAAGRPRGAIAAMVDISARKQVEAQLLKSDSELRQSQRLLDLAQEAGHVGFFNYQFDTDALSWTPGQAKLFGIEGAGREPVGFETTLGDWIARIDPEDRGTMDTALLRALAVRQEAANVEYRVTLDDGSLRWLSSRISLSYGPDGQPQRMVGVTLDITDRKRAEEAGAELMEREQAARRIAEAANRAKDEFLAMLGHELRNPLSAISSAVEVLNRSRADDEMAASAREIIARQTLHLSHMMGDLLDVTRVISGKVMLSRRPLDLGALVRRALDTLALTGEAAQHRLVADLAECWVEADATRIEQVVTNLVGNALKYTPAGRQVSVSLAATGGDAVLQVCDEGDGIAPELLPRVFDLFVQGERALDRRAGGLGIGLSLVKRLVELHGGTVSATSSPAGSRFEVRLPRVEAVRASPPRAECGARPGLSVLVVEDNPDSLQSMCDLLRLDGHRVSGENSGTTGLETLLAEWPDVAIVDIGLPGLNGFELALAARSRGYAGRMIAVSGYGQHDDVQRAMKSGFDLHAVKPVDAQQLRRWLRDGAHMAA